MRSLRTRLPVREIYRQLLREATYLPPLCQPYAKEQIRTRFHKHIHDSVDDPQTKARIRKAQHALRDMWAANHGVVDSMFRILMLTYGRVGKRRRELIKALLRIEPPADSEELANQIKEDRQEVEGSGKKKKKKLPRDWLDEWNLPKLHALATSQANVSFWSPKAELKSKRLDPEKEIPEKNIWGRPLVAKLKRSKKRKWYKALINKIMPPVGRDEWETLRLLATGRADRSMWEMPTRRPLAKVLSSSPSEEAGIENKAWDWKAYATQAVRHVERGSSRSQKARTGEEGEAPYGLGTPIGLHNYDRTRLWKRLYAKVWGMTPVMEEAPESKSGWRIEWGKLPKEVPVATVAQRAFFVGAETAGNPKRRKMKQK